MARPFWRGRAGGAQLRRPPPPRRRSSDCREQPADSPERTAAQEAQVHQATEWLHDSMTRRVCQPSDGRARPSRAGEKRTRTAEQDRVRPSRAGEKRTRKDGGRAEEGGSRAGQERRRIHVFNLDLLRCDHPAPLASSRRGHPVCAVFVVVVAAAAAAAVCQGPGGPRSDAGREAAAQCAFWLKRGAMRKRKRARCARAQPTAHA